MGLDQPALGRVDVSIAFVVETRRRVHRPLRRRATGSFALRPGLAARRSACVRSGNSSLRGGRTLTSMDSSHARTPGSWPAPASDSGDRSGPRRRRRCDRPARRLPIAHFADVGFATIYQRQATAARAAETLNHSRILRSFRCRFPGPE